VIDYFTKEGGCFGGPISHDDYLQLVKSRRDSLQLKKRALEKIGLDEDQVNEIPPAYFEGYVLKDAWAKKTDKGTWVSSAYQVSWVFFGSEQIYLFSHTFHMDEDKKTERTDEFFYKDVTSFSTTTENENIKTLGDTKQEVESQRFAMVVPGDKLYMSMDGCPDAEQTIQAMKQKLREKKAK
jgi:hypothetical protein